MADNAPILVIVPPRTAAKQEAEEDWGPVGGPSTLAPGHPHLLEGSFPARGDCARVFSDQEATSGLPTARRNFRGTGWPRKLGPSLVAGLSSVPKFA
jgi:hypothetical protein